MLLLVKRFHDNGNTTRGLLYLDGLFECFTLEDEEREVKVMGETRIPEGEYEIKLRAFGGHHERYKADYGSVFHRGMLEIMDVPGFTDILIHKGNNEKHTMGCLLVGETCTQTEIGYSEKAYLKLYPKVRDAILTGEKVKIRYIKDYGAK